MKTNLFLLSLLFCINLGSYSFAQNTDYTDDKGLKQDSTIVQSFQDLNQEVVGLYQQGRYQEALLIAQKALKQAEKEFGKKHPDYALSLFNLGSQYNRLSNYAKAESLYIEAKNTHEEVLGKKNPDYARYSHNLAFLYYKQGLYTQAEPLYIEAKNIREEVFGKKHPVYASSCGSLAVLYEDQTLYTKAEPLYIEAKNIREEVFGKKHPDYANSCNNLASIYHSQGLYTQAEPLYIEAKNIREEVLGTKHPEYATSCNNLAALYQDQGLYTKAEPLHIEAKNITEEVLGEKHPDYANSCNNLATLYQAQGLYTKAEPLFMEAKNIWKEVLGTKHLYYATFCDNLATLYQDQGLYTKAEPLYIEAKNITEEVLGTKHPDYALSCNNLATLYQAQGLYEKAEPLYIEAKNIWKEVLGRKHPFYANSCNNLAELYKNQGLYSKAEPLYLEAKKIEEEVLGKKHPSYAESCNNLAFLYYAQGLYSKAEPLLLEAIHNKLDQISILLPNLSEEERKEYIQSLNLYFINFYHFSSKYYDTKPEIAAEVLDFRLKTKGLLFQSFQKVQREILSSGDSILIGKYQQWKDKRSVLAKVYELPLAEKEKRGIDENKLKAEAEKLEKELSKSVSTLSKFGTLTKLEWQDVQNQLKKSEALVEIIRVQSAKDTVQYLALIITPDTQNQPEMLVLENGRDLEQKYIKYYNNVIKSKRADKYSYEQFWKSIDTQLPLGVKHVYFSADGVYHQINLQTLQNPEDDTYLSDKYTIQVLGTPADLIRYAGNKEAQKKKLKKYQMYLFGYPLYDAFTKESKDGEDRTLIVMDSTQRFFNGGKVSTLPGTKTEVENITKLAQKEKIKARVFLAREANEETLKNLKNPDILHIATHGFFLSDISQNTDDEGRNFAGISNKKFIENPLLRSGLLFAGAEASFNNQLSPEQSENGILTAEEALSLNLEGTNLVVLSACETGLGEISNGEGVYGLQRAFQQAGAKSVLMSLWTVSDEATQKMMTYFYENLLQKKQDKRTAFRNAQKQLREEFPEPYYWGAFVMVGE